jgi:hypothetical protein
MKMPYIEYAPESKTSPIPWAAMPTYNNLPAE